MDLKESKVTVPLDHYLELVNFKKEIEDGKIYTEIAVEASTSRYMSTINQFKFFTKEEAITKLVEVNKILIKELKEKKSIVKESSEKLGAILKGIRDESKIEANIKKMSIFEFIKWRRS
jgi:hypothetical protein